MAKPLAFLSLIALAVVGNAKACIGISSWNELKKKVKDTMGSGTSVVLCPFRIDKPADDRIQVNGVLHLACGESKQCIIRGGGSHFHIHGENSHVSLSGFVIRGATTGAIRVFQTSVQTHEIRDCLFRNNDNGSNRVRGGAIRLDPGVSMMVTASRFYANKAVRGGAIYHRGSQLSMENCVFVQNEAKIGGAIAVELGSTVMLMSSRFLRNQAVAIPGGAIWAKNTSDVIFGDGVIAVGNSDCDGIYSDICSLFATSLRESTTLLEIGSLESNRYGIQLSHGLTIRLIAQTGEYVNLDSPDVQETVSGIPFHVEPDGAHTFGFEEGGWVYVSNSEGAKRTGGVYSLEFDENGGVRNYTSVLSNTTRNCNGGATPWGTWISCEEYAKGQCWQVDPKGRRPSQKTSLGGPAGGWFEAFAYTLNDGASARPHFFVTEDRKNGALRRFRPDPNKEIGWSMLHGGGTMDYLEFLPNKKFRWTSSLSAGRKSAEMFYQNSEGIVERDGNILFVSKVQKELITLNLKDNTYAVESTDVDVLEGGGSFHGQPDYLISSDQAPGNLLFFSEDGGNTPGIYVYDGQKYYTLLEARGEQYQGDETTGLAFSPDGMFFYFCLQENGLLFEVKLSDGRAFNNPRLLKWK